MLWLCLGVSARLDMPEKPPQVYVCWASWPNHLNWLLSMHRCSNGTLSSTWMSPKNCYLTYGLFTIDPNYKNKHRPMYPARRVIGPLLASAWRPGLCTEGIRWIQPERGTWICPPVGPPLTERVIWDWCNMDWVAVKAGSLMLLVLMKGTKCMGRFLVPKLWALSRTTNTMREKFKQT